MNNKNSHTAPRFSNDPRQELAGAIYTRMCASIYAVTDSKKPDPMAVARLSLKLAEIFMMANLEAETASEAREAVQGGLEYLDIDFASIGAARDINARPRSRAQHPRRHAVSLARAA
jgi:hypothetical protein